MADVLAGKRVEALKEAISKLRRVTVLWYSSFGISEPQWARKSARSGAA